MKTTFLSEFIYAAKQGPRLFFAPLVGAYKEVRAEMDRISLENDQRARAQAAEQAQAQKHR